MQQVSMACSRFSQPVIAVATAGHHHQLHLQQQQQLHPAAAPPAKKTSKGKKAAAAAAAAAEESAVQAPPAVTGAAGAKPAVGNLGVSEAPVKRKRGPYKKRVKKEGEEKPIKQRKKKAITMMPALEAFAKRIQPPEGGLSQQVTVTGPDDGQGPSKRARCAFAHSRRSRHLLMQLLDPAFHVRDCACPDQQQPRQRAERLDALSQLGMPHADF